MIFGTYIYGSVKKVDGTSIATSFAMLMGFPLWPIESLYYAGRGESKFQGIPFVFGGTATAIRGLPMAAMDRLSVLITYVRAVSLVLAVITGMVFLISFVPDKQGKFGAPTPTQTLIERYAGLSGFVLSVSAGILTYCFWAKASQRERAIRHACGQVLGIAADPAFLSCELAESLRQGIANTSMPAAPGEVQEMIDVVRQLIEVRAQMALGFPREHLGRRTEDLLKQLSRPAHMPTSH